MKTTQRAALILAALLILTACPSPDPPGPSDALTVSVAMPQATPYQYRCITDTECEDEERARQKREGRPAFYCGATTKKGTPCRRRVRKAGTRCFLHDDAETASV